MVERPNLPRRGGRCQNANPLLKINVTAVGWVQAGTCRLSGSTLIAMVQTANFREAHNVADRGRLYGTRSRAVLAERKMRSGVMMVLKIARQNVAQMALVEDDDVI